MHSLESLCMADLGTRVVVQKNFRFDNIYDNITQEELYRLQTFNIVPVGPAARLLWSSIANKSLSTGQREIAF